MAKDSIKFKIDGIAEVKRMLSSLPKTANDKVLLDINRAAAKIVKEQLAADTPSGDNNKKSADKAANNVIITKGKRSKTSVVIGFAKKAWHIFLIERGTKVRKLKGRGRYKAGTNRGSITRKPFIQQSHAKAYPKVIDFFTSKFLTLANKSLKNQAKRINRKNLKRK